MALASEPAVLLADEPTGKLDEATAADVLDLLKSLCTESNMAFLTVIHNAAVAERADEQLTMRDGVLNVTDDDRRDGGQA